ncbi:MAG: ABC transporter substrate-binding protein [Methylohalobius sp.]|nr:ABC transporter substrate-binding protein [Methylohalobius sp.]
MGFEFIQRAQKFFVLALTSLTMLVGCRSTSPLVLAYHPFAGYAPAYLAQSLELWPTKWIESRLTTSSSQSAKLLRTGQADAALLTLDEVLRLVASGVALRVVLVVDQSLGADVVLARAPLVELAELRNRRIGYEPGTVSELLARELLDAAGLTPSDAYQVPFRLDQQEAAWRRGEVDFLVTFHPVSARLRRQGAVVVFDSRKTPQLILDVLAVREQALHSKRAALSALIEGWFRGLERVQRYEEDTRWRLTPWLGLTPEEVYAGFDGLKLFDVAENRAWLQTEGGARLSQRAHMLADWMKQHELLASPAVPELACDDFLPPPRLVR